MKDKDFFNQLQDIIPYWVSRGWVSPQNKAAILASLSNEESEDNRNHRELDDTATIKPSFFVFTFLGISLLSIGIILFFASHWQVIPKIAKLALLFGSLWVCYALAGYLLMYKKLNSPLHWFGQLLLFLGVVIFGANIALIAQIYHIDAHFPNGILIWSLGAWLVAVLLKQQACIIISLILALLWSVTESQFFLRSIHWMYLPVFFLNIIPILRYQWGYSWHIALITLILWLTHNILWLSYPFEGVEESNLFAYYFGLCALGSLSVFSLCRIMLDNCLDKKTNAEKTEYKPLQAYSSSLITLEHYGLFFFLANLFYLSFPDMLVTGKLLQKFHLTITGLFIAILILIYAWLFKAAQEITKQHKIAGGLLLVFLSALVILNQFNLNHSWLAVGFNLLFACFILWFIAIGYELKDKIYINLAFLFFAIFVIARYFDVFWDLLNRSFFFMAGGILLLLGSYLLEKKRRAITQGIKN